ncbi:MAG: hypothetical protein ACM3ZE_07555 [Myxococcales bacterium]
MPHTRRPVGLVAIVLVFELTSSAAHAQSATVETASKAQLQTATESFERGVAAMDSERFDEALEQFRLSYQTVNSPNSSMMVGRALVKLGRLPEAYRELEQTIASINSSAASQKKYRKTFETAQKELEEIQGKLSFLTIHEGAQVTVQGQPVPFSAWNQLQPVMPGPVTVVATLSDGRKLQKELVLKAGEKADFAVEPPPANAPAPTPVEAPKHDTPTPARGGQLNRTTAGLVVGAVGVIGVGAFVGLGIVGASSYGDVYGKCLADNCPRSAIDDQGSKSLFRGIGYAGLGIGVLGLGAATWLLLTSGDTSATATALSIGPGSVHLTRHF